MPTVILSAARTPIGSFGGSLSSIPAPQLGATAIKAALERAGVAPENVEEVIIGNVLTAGVGQSPARQAALGAGIPNSVPTLTIGKVCGSGMKAVMLADQVIRAGDANLVVAGGQESMSLAPFLLPNGRYGYKFGDGKIIDSMQYDGLTDAYDNVAMGVAADACAVACNIVRNDKMRSQSKATAAPRHRSPKADSKKRSPR
ncbi:MAG: acetyl-CoA acetyltransferase [Chlorobi bacterium OLB7]|nr:MAG: acetyl-CoA acetyltransferase [Chlorobi bacterium OLB7]